MRNQPHSQWQVIDAAAARRESAWSLDQQVELRTWLIGLLAVLAVLAVAARLMQIQVAQHTLYLQNANPVTVATEPIPAVDGRIYSSDGQLLAYDDQHFTLAVHYRWLQDPPDPRWLRQQIREQIRDRSTQETIPLDDDDPQIREQAETAVLEKRHSLWQRLAQAGGLNEDEFEQKRREIQQRIETISETVNRHHQSRLSTPVPNLNSTDPSSLHSWRDLLDLVKKELTTPPQRHAGERIIIKEELEYHPIAEDIPIPIVAEVEAHPSFFPGVRVLPSTTRVYPLGERASHVIGLRGRVRDDQIQERKQEISGIDPLAYASGDRQGRFGVERSYNATLRGLPGSREVKKNRAGEILSIQQLRASRSGKDLVLSINSQLQLTCEELLDELIPAQLSLVPPLPAGSGPIVEDEPKGGCLLVMNVHSGELLAAASAPRPSLSLLAANRAKYWRQLNGDERAPLLFRMTQVLLPPGSTYKPVTAIALCETEGIPRELIHCQGFLDDPTSHRCAIFQLTGTGHGELDLLGALSQSCNVYFFSAARRLKATPLVQWSERLGFGKPTGVDLPFEQSGHVPAPRDNQQQGKYRWYPGDTMGLAIGQSYLTVTPLQVLVMTAAIANGGQLLQPRVVNRIMSDGGVNGQVVVVPEVQSRKLNISHETLDVVRAGLEQSVSSPQGTARRTVFLKHVGIAGKTGTAQTGPTRQSHAWFTGYVPADRPQYAFVVLLEEGGSGGKQAGPLARKLVERMLELKLIEASHVANSL